MTVCPARPPRGHAGRTRPAEATQAAQTGHPGRHPVRPIHKD